MKFDHVGYRTEQKRVGEFFYAPNKVWITDSDKNPYKIEWLRYEEDSPVKEPVKSSPHIGYKVENLKEAMKGLKLLLGPLLINENKTVAFCQTSDGAVIELIETRR